jgi:small-conductance mechanosensitive channel
MILLAQANASDTAVDIAETATNQASQAGFDFLSTISSSLNNTMVDMWAKALEMVPKLAAMLVILLVGYIVARVLRWLARTVLSKLQVDMACDKIGLHEVTQSLGIKAPASHILAQLIFWSIMLTFLVASVDALGMSSVTNAINSVLSYIPNVIGATVMLVFGLMLANLARQMIGGACERLGIEYGHAVGNLAYGIIVIMVGSLVIGQLNMNTALVDRMIEITVMAVGAALALALGFGTRDMAKQVVAGVYARESFPAGSKLDLGDQQKGTVQSVRAVNTAIEREDGRIVVIPNAELMEMRVTQDI